MAFRSGRGRKFWEEAVERFERSSVTQEAFARQLGVSSAALRHWRLKLRREREGQSSGSAPGSIRLMPVTVTSAPTAEPMEVGVEGLVVRFRAGTDPVYVAHLLAALRERR